LPIFKQYNNMGKLGVSSFPAQHHPLCFLYLPSMMQISSPLLVSLCITMLSIYQFY
jgi:hypothetical protein